MTARLPFPRWARPGLGGLALGVFCVPIIWFVGWRLAQPGQGLGLLGGGYGAVQVAITGADWLPRRLGRRRRCCCFCAWPRSSPRR